VYRFGVGGAAEVWIGSADLMHRNLDRRVEALVRVTDRTAQAELEALLEQTMSDATTAFELTADGSWTDPVSVALAPPGVAAPGAATGVAVPETGPSTAIALPGQAAAAGQAPSSQGGAPSPAASPSPAPRPEHLQEALLRTIVG
jgi:hypothetical protein